MSDLRRGTLRAGQPVSSVEGYQEEGKQLYFLILMRLQKRLGRQGRIPGTEDLVKMELQIVTCPGSQPQAVVEEL